MTYDDVATVLSENECVALLGSRDLGRVAFRSEDTVEIFPVNYGLDGSTICFRTDPGTKRASACRQPPLSVRKVARCPDPRTLGTSGPTR